MGSMNDLSDAARTLSMSGTALREAQRQADAKNTPRKSPALIASTAICCAFALKIINSIEFVDLPSD